MNWKKWQHNRLDINLKFCIHLISLYKCFSLKFVLCVSMYSEVKLRFSINFKVPYNLLNTYDFKSDFPSSSNPNRILFIMQRWYLQELWLEGEKRRLWGILIHGKFVMNWQLQQQLILTKNLLQKSFHIFQFK